MHLSTRPRTAYEPLFEVYTDDDVVVVVLDDDDDDDGDDDDDRIHVWTITSSTGQAHPVAWLRILEVVWCHGRLLEQLLDHGGAHMQEFNSDNVFGRWLATCFFNYSS